MKEFDIIKKAVSRKHPCHEVHKAIETIEKIISEAPMFFSTDDFDGEKEKWLKKAGLL